MMVEFISLPVVMNKVPVDYLWQRRYIVYARDYMKDNVPVPGRCVVIVKGLKKGELFVNMDVAEFVKQGFIPIVHKEEQSLRKTYLNPDNIKSIREYVGSKPQQYFITMDCLNPSSKMGAEPYNFITTDNIIKSLATEHLAGSSI